MGARPRKGPDLRYVLAANLKRFKGKTESVPKMAERAGVSPNTLRNLLFPDKQPVYHHARVDVLQDLAAGLKCQPWELLHPDIERATSKAVTSKVTKERAIGAETGNWAVPPARKR